MARSPSRTASGRPARRRILGMDERAVDFNKELVFGELGSLVGAPLVAYAVSQFTMSATAISFSAVIGGLTGASLFWLAVHVLDQKKRKTYEARHLAKDISRFTPAALLLGIIVYQPVLFFDSRYLLHRGDTVLYSVLGSQLLAFALFLLAMNIYRRLFEKYTGKELFR